MNCDIQTGKRSIEQNNKLWKIIREISKVTGNDTYDVYCSLLERADVASDFIIGMNDIESELRKSFRAVKFERYYEEPNGEIRSVYKVYIGSSKFSKDEMRELIEIATNIAAEFGIVEELCF